MERALAELAAQTSYRVRQRWLSPRRTICLVNLRRASSPEVSAPASERGERAENRIHERGAGALLAAGYITTPIAHFADSLRPARRRLSSGLAGGIAAFCFADVQRQGEEQLFLWSTRPDLRVIAWSATPTFFVAGTRPRLVHAVARAFAAPRFDQAYVRASLCGWSLEDLTPFEGTQLVPVDALLCVNGDGQQQLPHPGPSSSRKWWRFSWQEVSAYKAALAQAVEPLRALPGFELRLSGGKDSRLVAAALHARGMVPTVVSCHRRPEEREAQIAEQVARSLAFPIRFDRPVAGYRGTLLDTVRHSMMLADGFFATEPRHIAFPPYDVGGEQEPGIVLGHIELQKGGWARDALEKRAAILGYCRVRITPMRNFVVQALTDAVHQLFDRTVEQLALKHDAEYGYWLNYRFRVCRWLTSHYLVHSNELLPVYPLVDERVVHVVHGVRLHRLISERLMYETGCSFAPQLANLPLFDSDYRFAAEEPRNLVELPASPDPPHVSEPRYPRMDHTRALQEACAHIRGGGLAAELRELTRPSIWQIFEDPTPEHMKSLGSDEKPFIGFAWTCYQASVLFSEGLPDDQELIPRE